MSTPPSLEPTAVATLLLSALAGPTLAKVIGPYAVIVVAGLVGASWALSEESAASRRDALLFLLRVTFTAALLTVGITAALERFVLDGDQARWLFAPIALILGSVGNDWPRVLRWIRSKVRRRIEREDDAPPPRKGKGRR